MKDCIIVSMFVGLTLLVIGCAPDSGSEPTASPACASSKLVREFTDSSPTYTLFYSVRSDCTWTISQSYSDGSCSASGSYVDHNMGQDHGRFTMFVQSSTCMDGAAPGSSITFDY